MTDQLELSNEGSSWSGGGGMAQVAVCSRNGKQRAKKNPKNQGVVDSL